MVQQDRMQQQAEAMVMRKAGQKQWLQKRMEAQSYGGSEEQQMALYGPCRRAWSYVLR